MGYGIKEIRFATLCLCQICLIVEFLWEKTLIILFSLVIKNSHIFDLNYLKEKVKLKNG